MTKFTLPFSLHTLLAALRFCCQALFGKKGTDFDFQGSRYQDNKQRLEKLNTEQKKLSKNINKKAIGSCTVFFCTEGDVSFYRSRIKMSLPERMEREREREREREEATINTRPI